MNTLLIIYFFVFTLFPVPSTADDQSKTLSEEQISNRLAVVSLDHEAQKLSGIETITLKPVTQQREFTAHGKAINLQPLMELRHRYLLAVTENTSAKAKLRQAEQSFRRQQDLFSSGVGSKRNLQEHQVQWQTYKAQVDAADVQGKAIIDEMLLNWGKVITAWAISSHSDQLNAFMSGDQTLLQITLPANKHLSDSIQTIYVEASGNRSQAHKADLISMAAQIESVAQGESYYFQTADKNIITGMNVTAWIPESNAFKAGIIIPKSALIWYLDQAFVYLKTAEETFTRRPIDQYTALADGYFISGAFKPGQQIVTKGAQMLLSEELRSQIPNEDDD